MSPSPESTCDDPECDVRDEMESLGEALVSPPDDESTAMIDEVFDTYRRVLNADPNAADYQIRVALPALFISSCPDTTRRR